MTDRDINNILKKKEAAGVKVTYHNSKEEKKLRKKVSGLYHKKILIIDEDQLYIGSANCSSASLSLHGNQIFGFSNKALIQSILLNKSLTEENIEFYLLPKDRVHSLQRLISIISNASKSISISMYALTHKDIIEEIISAHTKGVNVRIYLDQGMVKGTLKKQTKILKTAGIPIYLRAKSGINHHKCALIDDTYIFGSINWSAAGFKRNEETLMIINQMDDKLTKEVNKFICNLHFYSTPLK